jgi:hypothetical protein
VTTDRCYVCGEPGDLRPYGVNGQPICFGCMFSDPERKAEGERQLARRLRGLGPEVTVGEPDGPRTFDPKTDVPVVVDGKRVRRDR